MGGQGSTTDARFHTKLRRPNINNDIGSQQQQQRLSADGGTITFPPSGPFRNVSSSRRLRHEDGFARRATVAWVPVRPDRSQTTSRGPRSRDKSRWL